VRSKAAKKITKLRKARGWSQAELSRRTEIHPSRISHLEGGSYRVTPSYARRIAKAFEIPAEELGAA